MNLIDKVLNQKSNHLSFLMEEVEQDITETEDTSNKKYKDGILLATSPSLEMAKNAIAKYWYNTPDKISFKELSKNIWSIYQSGKLMPNNVIIKKGKRYRFERVVN